MEGYTKQDSGYIKREDALNALNDMGEEYIAQGQNARAKAIAKYGTLLRNLPSADVVPVKHGKWSETYNGDHAPILFTYTCSACKGESFLESNFCPNCGAKMEVDG